jgi:hypothetical protein
MTAFLCLLALLGCEEDGRSSTEPDQTAAVAVLVLSGDRTEGTVGEAVEPVEVQVVDKRGSPVAGVEVRFQVTAGGGVASPADVVSDADGVARSHWTLGPLAGEQRIELQLAGSGAPLGEVRAEARPGPAHEVRVLPEAVTLPAGMPFGLEARVRDAFGNLIAQLPVEWSAEDEAVAQVSPTGRVTGLRVGTTSVDAFLSAEAAAAYPDIAAALADSPAAHHRDGHAGGRSRIDVVEGDSAYVSATSGDGQIGMTGETLPEELGVQVTDAAGVPLRQVQVHWQVTRGGGSVSEAVTRTDGQGRASVVWTLGPEAGTQRVEARVGDLGAATFTATAHDQEGDVGSDDAGSDDGGSDDGGSDDGGSDGGDSGDDGSDDPPPAPGTVTDLSVVSTDDSSATLRFTQVDDGTGSGANYEIRFALSPIGWGWGGAEKVSEGSCAGEVLGDEAGAPLTCTVEGLAPGTTYDFQLVSYRGLIADGSRVYGGLSNVATGTTDEAGSGDGDSDEDGGGSVRTLFSEDWSSGDFRQWDDGPNRPSTWRVVQDPALAYTGSHVLEITIPEGQHGGYLSVFRSLAPGSEEMYVRVRLRLAPGWIGLSRFFNVRATDPDHSNWPWSGMGGAGTCPNGDDRVRIGVAGWDEDSNPEPVSRWYNYWHGMWPEPDGVTCWGRLSPERTDRNATYNTAAPRIPIDRWVTVEIHVRMNTPGQRDGFARMWIDGQLRSDWKDESWRTTDALLLNIFQLDLRGTANRERRLYFDDILVMDGRP